MEHTSADTQEMMISSTLKAQMAMVELTEDEMEMVLGGHGYHCHRRHHHHYYGYGHDE